MINKQRKRTEEALSEQLEFEQLIADIASRLAGTEPEQLEVTINSTLQALGRFLHTERSFFAQFLEDGNRLVVTNTWAAEGFSPLSQIFKDSAIEILNSITGLLNLEPGVVSWRIYQDLDNEQVITLVQEWESQTDLDNYIRSKEYNKILALMEISNRQPEVHFYDVDHISGLEFVESVRS